MDGYVKLWRKSLDSPVWNNQNLWRFWMWCLMKASYKERTVKIGYQDVLLSPGQFIFGRHKASLETGLSEQTIRTSIDSLRKRQNLTIKSTKQYSIVTIVNWDKYQGEVTNEVTNSQPTTNQRLTTNKKDKKDKKVKEDNILISNFDMFWKEYPKKRNKGDAEKSFKKVAPEEQLFTAMLAAIELAKKSEQWLKDGGQFIPYPATWLNKRGWEDEISTASTNPRALPQEYTPDE